VYPRYRGCGITVSEVYPMNTERQRQDAEHSRERAEDQREDTENKRNINENKRQMAEKQREVGELLRDAERAGERLIVEYSTHALLMRIEGFEQQLSQVAARLGSVEALLKAMHGQLQQLLAEKESVFRLSP
jgi:chromosome segregation ATPase